jgi:deoxycytidylate deaminase
MRNKKKIKDAILFATKPPCNECAPLIAIRGIKTVVVDDDVRHHEKPKRNELGYDIFPKMVEDGTFVCYQTK